MEINQNGGGRTTCSKYNKKLITPRKTFTSLQEKHTKILKAQIGKELKWFTKGNTTKKDYCSKMTFCYSECDS